MALGYMKRLGMFIARILRHSPETVGVTMDEHGWVNVEDLIYGVRKAGFESFCLDQLITLVATDNKERYTLNEEHTLVRANQGHSIPVDVELYYLSLNDIEKVPILYHGTSTRRMQSINLRGILKMGRNYVQLSTDINTAFNVGNRHNRKHPGDVAIYVIDVKKLFSCGYEVLRSVNNVYLVEHVPPECFKEIIIKT